MNMFAPPGVVVIDEGSTYAISADPYDGWVKLGRSSRNPERRIPEMQTGNPRLLVVRAVWPYDVESYLKETFKDFRGQGEWFALPLDLVDHMQRLSRRPAPWFNLVTTWTPERIREAAGVDCCSLTALAERFAVLGVRDEAA